jgi:uncharacterized protein YjeT (DUF2065 family)
VQERTGIWERLSFAGMVLIVIGALLGYLGEKIAIRFLPQQQGKAAVIIKLTGLAVVIAGMLIQMDII